MIFSQTIFSKYLHGLIFHKHIEEKIKKANKGIGLLKFLSRYTTRVVLDRMYKMYVRPHLDYGDVIYHEQNANSMQLLESVQYKAALIVSGCWKGTSRDKIYRELGWESLKDRRYYRRLVLYFKIINDISPGYLKQCIKPIPLSITKRYSCSFFPYCAKHWDTLSASIKNSPSISIFKNALLKAIRPLPSPCYNNFCHELRRLTQLRVDFSDLREHRYRHRFNCVTPICSCGMDIESTTHFLLSCSKFACHRRALFADLEAIVPGITSLPPVALGEVLLYGSKDYCFATNSSILSVVLKYIKVSKRFHKLEAYSLE